MSSVEAVLSGVEPWAVVQADCLGVLPTLPDACVDCVVTDPPYPEIDRAYGRWSEAEWFALMNPVVEQCRRVLKPTGSAVFILQPNSERVGRMRTWLWRFLADWGERWGVVQDAYWWNTSTLPLAGACKEGLMRPSLKACVWLGPSDCWRDQGAVLLRESLRNEQDRLAGRFEKGPCPSRKRSDTEQVRDDMRRLRTGTVDRGGTTPFNVLPIGSASPTSGGTHGHPGATPLDLMCWWARYLCPQGGVVLDPFLGSGTAGIAARLNGFRFVGIEANAGYAETARARIAAACPLDDASLRAAPAAQPTLFDDAKGEP